MQEIQEREIPAMKEAARQRARELDWAQIAERTRQVYEGEAGDGRADAD